MRQWFRKWKNWEIELITIMVIIAIITIVLWRSFQPDYTLTIYKTFTTNNITFVDIDRVPAYEVQLDKGEYFSWDGWTIKVK